MTTVSNLATRVQGLYDNITTLQNDIKNNFTIYSASGNKNNNLKFNAEIRDLKEEEKKYDQEFREQEHILQATGGKTRHQTLQEFVFLFFFTSLGLIGISLAIYSYITTKNMLNPLKIIGLIIFIALLVSAIIIKYA